MSGPERMPFFEKFKNKNSSSSSLNRARESQLTESDFGGLAYDESDAGSGSLSKSSSSATRKSEKLYGESKKSSTSGSRSSRNDEPVSPPMHARSVSSASSSYSQANTRFTARSAGALASALDALEEDVRTPPLPIRDFDTEEKRSMKGKEREGEREDGMLAKPKAPTRSRTTGGGGFDVDPYGRPVRDSALGRTGLSPSMSTREVRSREKEREVDAARARLEMGERKSATKKVRSCVRCDRRIEDGKWIQSEGGVLCEKCWKNMYLPKVCPLGCLSSCS